MARKKVLTAKEIMEWKPSETQRRHGQNTFAARLCKQGKFEDAKKYCAKVGIPYPPFSKKILPASESLVAGPQRDDSAGHEPTEVDEAGQPRSGPVTLGEAGEAHAERRDAVSGEAQPPVETSSPAPSVEEEVQRIERELAALAPPDGGITRYEAAMGAPIPPIPDISAPAPLRPGVRRATVEGFCLNKRLLKIKLEDGEQVSMWKDRQAYRLGEQVEVMLERGTEGVNPIYEEVRKPI